MKCCYCETEHDSLDKIRCVIVKKREYWFCLSCVEHIVKQHIESVEKEHPGILEYEALVK